MTSDPNSPDRRPLVYGGVALLILLAAAFLFWPHGPDEEIPTRMVLTPEAARPDATAPAEQEGADGVSGPETTLAATEETARIETETVELPEESMQQAEKRIVDATPERKVESKPATTTRTTTGTPASPPKLGAPTTPQAEGSYVLNVGAFSTRSNAEARSRELRDQGLSTHVHAATKNDGTTFYRVRVGYFPSRSVAEGYGNWLKRQYSLDSWASGR